MARRWHSGAIGARLCQFAFRFEIGPVVSRQLQDSNRRPSTLACLRQELKPTELHCTYYLVNRITLQTKYFHSSLYWRHVLVGLPQLVTNRVFTSWSLHSWSSCRLIRGWAVTISITSSQMSNNEVVTSCSLPSIKAKRNTKNLRVNDVINFSPQSFL